MYIVLAYINKKCEHKCVFLFIAYVFLSISIGNVKVLTVKIHKKIQLEVPIAQREKAKLKTQCIII